MTIEHLIERLASEFEIEDKNSLSPETSFRNMKEWSSMHGLIIIALADSEYGVTLNGNDLRAINTISDLFELIKSRK